MIKVLCSHRVILYHSPYAILEILLYASSAVVHWCGTGVGLTQRNVSGGLGELRLGVSLPNDNRFAVRVCAFSFTFWYLRVYMAYLVCEARYTYILSVSPFFLFR